MKKIGNLGSLAIKREYNYKFDYLWKEDRYVANVTRWIGTN